MDGDFAIFQELLNQQKTEKGVFAEFYDKAVKTDEVNDKGLTIFITKTYVRIQTKDIRPTGKR